MRNIDTSCEQLAIKQPPVPVLYMRVRHLIPNKFYKSQYSYLGNKLTSDLKLKATKTSECYFYCSQVQRRTGAGVYPYCIASTGIRSTKQCRDLRDSRLILQLDLIPAAPE
jgi:hypothetical protein